MGINSFKKASRFLKIALPSSESWRLYISNVSVLKVELSAKYLSNALR